MQTLHFSKLINVPRENVWHAMLDEETYKIWTSEFTPGSYYEGSWEKGAKIKFRDPKGNGMSSEIVENRKYEFISIRHLGIIKNGVEDFDSPEVKKWVPSFENYSFSEVNGATEVRVDMNISEEYVQMISEMWPKALDKLMEICEIQYRKKRKAS